MPESAFEYAPGEPLFRINAVRKSCEFWVSKFTAENLFDPVMNPGGCGGMAGCKNAVVLMFFRIPLECFPSKGYNMFGG